VNLALADGQVDAREDLAAAVGDRHHMEIADDQLAVSLGLDVLGCLVWGCPVECLGHESFVCANAVKVSIETGGE
jgi:hypothetical protein